MSKSVKRILFICGCGIFILFILLFCYIQFPVVILPTTSAPNTLTFVHCGFPDINQITLKYFADDELIDEYVLVLNVGGSVQTTQKYALPEVKEGRVEVNVDLEDGIVTGSRSVLTVNYSTEELYKKGLLIYVTTDYGSAIEINGFVYQDQYIDFISGKKRTTYLEKAGKQQWSIVQDAPKLKKIQREQMGYFVDDGRWKKENYWMALPVDMEKQYEE